jgi:AraC-like DNA-binding protein
MEASMADPDTGLRIEVLHAARERRVRGMATPERRLPGLLLEWSDRGGWRIEAPGPVLRAGPGAVLVLAPGLQHRLVATGPETAWTTCYAHIALTMSGGLIPDQARLPMVVPADRAVPLRRAMRALAGTRDWDLRLTDRIHRTALGWAVLDRLMQACPGVLGSDHDPGLTALMPLLRALESDPSRPWTRDGLARLAGCSATALHARFARALGQTPMAFVQRCRLARARHLMLTTAAPVAAIAEASGFPSTSHFHRAFRALEGCPPAAWRRAALAHVP